MYALSKRSLGRLEGVNPTLIAILEEGVKHSPYDFGIPQHGGLRTAEDQHYLFLSKKSTKDGYEKKSKHQSGNAADIYLYIDGRASWNKDKLEEVWLHLKDIAEECFDATLRWGGDWNMDGVRVDKDDKESFFDGAHIEILV